MNSHPLVSVVIPTYNRARDLERALKSVRAQTYEHWEVLVVDNHSTDDTDAVVSGFRDVRIKLYKVHNNGVIAVSRNVGITHARGEYVAFLDSDDWWSKRKLEESLRHLGSGADIVYHDLFRVTKPEQRFFLQRLRTRDLGHAAFNDLISRGNGLLNSGVAVRRETLRAIGGLSEDPRLVAAEDYDAWLRIAKTSAAFRRIPKTLGYYWAGGGNVNSPDRVLQTLRAIEEVYAKDLARHGEDGPVWFHYTRGRCHYRLKAYRSAKDSFDRVDWRFAPMDIWLKTQWMLLKIKLIHRVSRV